MNPQEILAKVKRLQLISTKLVENLLAGNYRSVFKGPGVEFDEAREYVEGDDARLIDWNVSSRLGNVFTKTFREERELTLFILFDVSASLFAHADDSARREVESLLCAVLTLAAVKNNDQVGGLFFSDRIERWIPPMKGKTHAMRLIQDMLSFDPTGRGSDLGLAIRTAAEALKRRGVCVILSDFKSAGYFRDLTLLSRKHDVIAVRIVDPLDEAYPRTGLVHLQDPETGETLLASGRSRAFRNQYTEFWANQRRQWLRECHRRGIDTLEIRTDQDPAQKLVEFFRRRHR
jgi:uncharacterized protein (DUF58 family)